MAGRAGYCSGSMGLRAAARPSSGGLVYVCARRSLCVRQETDRAADMSEQRVDFKRGDGWMWVSLLTYLTQASFSSFSSSAALSSLSSYVNVSSALT